MLLRILPVLIVFVLAFPGGALAKSKKTLTYRFSTIWSATVRMIRADRGYPIQDKDKETGYIMFTFPGKGAVKKCSAALEIVPIVDDQGYKRIRLQLHIAHQPSYVEVHLLDKLEQKLREEQGDPPAAEKAPKKSKPKDKSGSDDDDKGKDEAKKRSGK